jgi:hypothetical protein
MRWLLIYEDFLFYNVSLIATGFKQQLTQEPLAILIAQPKPFMPMLMSVY